MNSALIITLFLQDFWDWSWEELALYDLAEMIRNISSITSSKVFLVGHSQVYTSLLLKLLTDQKKEREREELAALDFVLLLVKLCSFVSL